MQKKGSTTKEWSMSNTAFTWGQNILLSSISLNWTSKYVSVKGQIVVKTCQSGSLKYIKYQDVEDEVEEQMQKRQTKNSSQRLWAVVRRGLEEEKRDGLRVVKKRFHYRETKEKSGTSSWMSTTNFQHAWETVETTMMKQKNERPERKRERTTQASHHWWRCSAESEKKWVRQQQQRKDARRKGKWKQHSEQNEALCHEQKWRAEAKMCVHVQLRKEMTTQKTKKLHSLFFKKKHEVNALKWKKSKKWWASSKATDGTQFYWTKRGDMNKLKYGRHIINTFSWELEKSTTNTESELCWTKGGGKESSTLSTSTNVPSLPRSWWTDVTSSWWGVYFLHSKYSDHHIEKMYTTIVIHMAHCNKYIPIIRGDFNAELGPWKCGQVHSQRE